MKEKYDAPTSELIQLLSDDIILDSDELPIDPLFEDDEAVEF